MTHSGHWYLSAFVWFIVAWHFSSRGTEAFIDYANAHRNSTSRVAVRAIVAVLLFVLVIGALFVIDHLAVGVFDDMNAWETCGITALGTILGIGGSVLLYVRSKEKQS